jgi:hypothetical protein
VVSAPKVVEDGLEITTRSRGGSRWGWLAVGVLVGLGLSVLIPGVEPADPASQPTLPPTTIAEEAPAVGGIRDVVSGFPDGLVGVMRSDGQSLELAIWPATGELFERSVTVGASLPPPPVAFDGSGRMLATLVPRRDSDLGVLYAGVPESAGIIAIDVSGYAWNDQGAPSLAYTTRQGAETMLWIISGSLTESQLVAQAVGLDGGVVAWGEWGFAIQEEDSVVLLTPGGEIKDSHPGRVLASYRTGWLAVQGDDVSMVSAGGGTRGLDREGLRDQYISGRFSSNGEFLALLTDDGMSIVDVEEETGVVESGVRPGVPQVVWSSDNRFVLYPGGGGSGFHGIVVVDTEDFAVQTVLDTRTFTGLGVLPVGGT